MASQLQIIGTASNRLFERRVRLLVATTVVDDFEDLHVVSTDIYEITDLRVRFDVKKTSRKEPNTAEIKIYNLSPRSRAALQKKGVRIELQAGYAGSLGTIYIGDSRDVEPPTHEGPDVVTTIQCGTSERAYVNARMSESWRAGTLLVDVARKIAGVMGLDFSAAEAQLLDSDRVFVNGHAAHGRASRELDRVLKGDGWEWSVQDGQLRVRRPGEPTLERIVELSPETGLIGSPEYGSPEKKGGKPIIKIRSLLQSDLRVGGQVVVTSERQTGTLLVNRLTHTGDTAGNEWYTDLEVVQHEAKPKSFRVLPGQAVVAGGE